MKNDIEFNVGDKVTYRPYEVGSKGVVTRVGISPVGRPTAATEFDERVFYEVLLDDEGLRENRIRETTGLCIEESLYFHNDLRELDNPLLKLIGAMIVKGNRLELPSDIVFHNYAQVKKTLTAAGGKYKKSGFEFKGDAQNIKDRLTNGDVINDKKKFQFFATPASLAEKLVQMADINDTHRVLEPSAGQGAIANLVRDTGAKCVVVELMDENVKSLEAQGYDVIKGSFLDQTEDNIGLFDRVIANPPFSKNQDIDHVKKMFSLLSPGGKVISITGTSWINGSQKKQVEFRQWLESMGAVTTRVGAGAFKESGTSIETVILEIDNSMSNKEVNSTKASASASAEENLNRLKEEFNEYTQATFPEGRGILVAEKGKMFNTHEVLGTDTVGVKVGGQLKISFSRLMSHYNLSEDSGKTWNEAAAPSGQDKQDQLGEGFGQVRYDDNNGSGLSL